MSEVRKAMKQGLLRIAVGESAEDLALGEWQVREKNRSLFRREFALLEFDASRGQ